jgi:large subunit ribosomal protein L9
MANLRALQQRERAIHRREAEKRDHAQGLVERLASSGIVIKAAVGEGGRLHGQVTSHQIAEAVEQQSGVKLDRRNIEAHAPIRELGDFTITARVYKDVRCEISLHVVSATAETESGEEEPPARTAAAPAMTEAPELTLETPEQEPAVAGAQPETSVAEVTSGSG